MNAFWNQRKTLSILGLLLCAAFFEVLFGGKTFFYRDFGVMSVPTTFYQRAAFWNGEIPLWNPYSNCGAPFLAQWGTMCLYPLSLIYLLLPFPWSLNFFCVLHLFIGGWGAYRFCRKLGLEEYPSTIGATIFVFNGVTLACLSWPNYCVAIGWMPWVVQAAKEAIEAGGRSFGPAVIFSALQLLAGVPEMVVLTWIICAGFGIECVVRSQVSLKTALARVAFIIALTSGIVAAQILPFIDLLLHSQRAAGVSAAKWAMPLAGWVDFVLPFFRVFKTPQATYFQSGQQFLSAIYLGAIAVLLGGAALYKGRDARIRWLAALACILIVVSFGPNTSFFRGLQAAAPFLTVARYPVKALLALPLIVALLSAFGWVALREVSSRIRAIFMTASFTAFVLFAAGALWYMRAHPLRFDRWLETLQNSYSRAAFLLAGLGALSLSWSAARPEARRAGEFLLIALLFFDSISAVPNQNPTAPSNLFSPLNWKQAHPGVSAPVLGGGRVFISPAAEDHLLRSNVADPVSDMIGKRLAEWSHLNLLDLIPKVNGSSTLQLKEQSVVQNLLYGTNQAGAGLLDYLGATLETASNQVVEWQTRPSARPLLSAGQEVKLANDDEALRAISALDFSPAAQVYLPRVGQAPRLSSAGASPAESDAEKTVLVSSVPSGGPRNARRGSGLDGRGARPTQAAITNLLWKPHLISFEISAAKAAIVSVAQSYSHNWQARVDGRKTVLLRANYAFQALVVPAGRHRVEIRYRDLAFIIGCAISFASLVGLLIFQRKLNILATFSFRRHGRA